MQAFDFTDPQSDADVIVLAGELIEERVEFGAMFFQVREQEIIEVVVDEALHDYSAGGVELMVYTSDLADGSFDFYGQVRRDAVDVCGGFGQFDGIDDFQCGGR